MTGMVHLEVVHLVPWIVTSTDEEIGIDLLLVPWVVVPVPWIAAGGTIGEDPMTYGEAVHRALRIRMDHRRRLAEALLRPPEVVTETGDERWIVQVHAA